MKDAGPKPPATNARRTILSMAAGGPGAQTLVVGVVVVAALYFAREIFVPLALAVLLSFVLTPPVLWLRRLGLGRMPSVLIVSCLAFAAILAFGTIIAGRVVELAEGLPQYERNIEQKIQSLKDARPGSQLIERASGTLRELGKKLKRPDEKGEQSKAAPPPGTPAVPAAEPLPVQIRQAEPGPLELLQLVIGILLEPLATAGIVILVVILILLQREDLRDRLIRLAGLRDLQRTTVALEEGMQRVARYLLMQLIVNVTYGIPVGIGLWVIGVPSPLLWGMLATVLRFVPYVGPFVAAAFPLILAIAVDPGWSTLLWTAALFIVLETVSNNLIEPWLYGSGTGLSAMAVVIGAIFWTWLWGAVGLLLSTPLTVCLVVLGRHIPQLRFMDTLLGNEPALTPAERLYQRLLAGDPDEAAEHAEEALAQQPLSAFYDDVALPALALAERDRARGTLDDEHRERVADSAMTLVEELSEHEDAAPPDRRNTSSEQDAAEVARTAVEIPNAIEPAPEWRNRPVLCVAGRDNLDQAAAAMLAQLAARRGIGARVAPAAAMQPSTLTALDAEGVRMVCISYMNEHSKAHARYLVRHLRRTMPEVPILVGFWTASLDDSAARTTLERIKCDFIATSLQEAVRQMCSHAQGTAKAQDAVRPAEAESIIGTSR